MDAVKALLELWPWIGYPSAADFVKGAVRARLEDELGLVAAIFGKPPRGGGPPQIERCPVCRSALVKIGSQKRGPWYCSGCGWKEGKKSPDTVADLLPLRGKVSAGWPTPPEVSEAIFQLLKHRAADIYPPLRELFRRRAP